ncbi:MAG: peptidoglycan editing factor PgeF [Holosporaceae bacterium]|nr:peptidoglycan editing factor PgeF [Holosporaceae bacterium]
MIKSSKIADPSVNHGFFGRKYGKSVGFYDSLNCSRFVGDNPEVVLQNLKIVQNEMRARNLITMNQVHGNACAVVDDQTSSDMQIDAMVTKTPDVAIGVLTADCAPILLWDKVNRLIGAVHAGWRGAASGVIQSTIQQMVQIGGDPKHILAAIGPCISMENYEVDDEFKNNFNGKGDCFRIINFKMHFDLPLYCRNRLLESGLDEDNIDVVEIDTYVDRENYFSYRFANKNTRGICGRQISVICLR